MPIKYAVRLLTALLFLCIQAFAAKSYDAIYVFGDSYCDVGNIYIATAGAIPASPPNFHGRFSNGPIWVEHLAGALKLSLQPSLAGGTDYAAGGAEVTQAVVTSRGTIPSVPQQIEGYLAQHGGHADPDALYVIEGGGNDILNARSTNPGQLGLEIALGIAGGEALLRRAGAKHFLIPNLLDIGQLPAAAGHTAFATEATEATNASLRSLLHIEDFLEGVRIYRVNVFALFRGIATDPTHFGFTNLTTPCLNPSTGTICADPDHTLFWDIEHPTEFGHSMFATLALGALTQ